MEESKIVREYDTTRDKCLSELIDEEKVSIYTKRHLNVIDKINTWINNAINCIKNHILFHKQLKEWRNFDYHYQLDMFAFCLRQLADALDGGHEIELTRTKKVNTIRKFADELQRDYLEKVYDEHREKIKDAESKAGIHVILYENGDVSMELHDDEHNKFIKEQVEQLNENIRKARKEHYDIINKILRGQDDKIISEKIEKIVEKTDKAIITDENKYRQDLYNAFFDGTGIESWWD